MQFQEDHERVCVQIVPCSNLVQLQCLYVSLLSGVTSLLSLSAAQMYPWEVLWQTLALFSDDYTELYLWPLPLGVTSRDAQELGL